MMWRGNIQTWSQLFFSVSTADTLIAMVIAGAHTYWNRSQLQINPSWLMFVLPYMLWKSRIGKDVEFSYITGTLRFTAAQGVVFYVGASSVGAACLCVWTCFPMLR